LLMREGSRVGGHGRAGRRDGGATATCSRPRRTRPCRWPGTVQSSWSTPRPSGCSATAGRSWSAGWWRRWSRRRPGPGTRRTARTTSPTRGSVDLGNRRLTVAGHARPLDDLTRQTILDWLDHRRARWPTTANPHLIVNQQTALGTRPVGAVSIIESLRGLTATHKALRVDRQLEEALTRGPDPLHLAAAMR
jgi:hypothetical protein